MHSLLRCFYPIVKETHTRPEDEDRSGHSAKPWAGLAGVASIANLASLIGSTSATNIQQNKKHEYAGSRFYSRLPTDLNAICNFSHEDIDKDML